MRSLTAFFRRSSKPAARHRRSTGRSRFAFELEPRLLYASSSTLLSYDFETTRWGTATATVAPFSTTSTTASAGFVNGAGTIDVSGTAVGSYAATLSLTGTAATGLWQISLDSGRLPLTNSQTDLAKLTFSFDLSARETRPLVVQLTSYDTAGNPTGSIQKTVSASAVNSFQRISTELSTFTPVGAGTFSPTAPSVGLTFTVSSLQGWSGSTGTVLRVDNVNLSKPAYYVSTTGTDTASGLTEASAFRSLQKANSVAQPGDIILVQGGTYTASGEVLTVTRGGTPSSWITYKNYPGQTPVLRTQGWNTIKIGTGSSTAISTGPSIAYVDIRGFSIRGYADDSAIGDAARNLDAADQLKTIGSTSIYNTNGITVEGRWSTNLPHHIRIADNNVELVPGGGINILEADRIQIENNTVRNTSYWTTYATSGISILSATYFDTAPDYHRQIVNNESSGNQTKIRWVDTGYLSDGNGIILDYNYFSPDRPSNTAYGRTLAQNNVTFFNGGSGIHAFNSRHVDILNNVAYLNGQSAQGKDATYYGQIFAGTYGRGITVTYTGTTGSLTSTYSGQTSADINIANNIIVAPATSTTGLPTHFITYNSTKTAEANYQTNTYNQITYRNNVYWGSEIIPPDANSNGNTYADPLFVNPSTNAATADFHLRPGSPAINRSVSSYSYSNSTYFRPVLINNTSPLAAIADPNVSVPNPITTTISAPATSLDGQPRGGVIDAGPFEQFAATPFVVRAQVGSTIGNNAINLGALALPVSSDTVYRWAVVASPTGAPTPTFSANNSPAAAATVATFSQAGSYTLAVTASNAAGASSPYNLVVNIAQTLSALTISPAVSSLATNSTQQFSVSGVDQFAQPITTLPAITWSVTGAGASISTSGLLTTGPTATSLAVTASSGSVFTTLNLTTAPALGAETSLFANSVPNIPNATDGVSYELGVKFRSSVAGVITAIRYYRAPSETGSHIGRIWSLSGQVLASVNFTNETASGWQTAYLATPLEIAANTTYLVTVNTNLYYVDTLDAFNTSYTNGPLTAIADGSNSLFGPLNQFPTNTYHNSNYFRDVIFRPYI